MVKGFSEIKDQEKVSNVETIEDQEIHPQDISEVTQEVQDTEKEVAALEEQIAGLKEQMLRALAESENSYKRRVKEQEEASKYAVGDFSRSLLEVADNLRRALDSGVPNPETEIKEAVKIESILTGIEMTEKALHNVFEKYGIVKINPKGALFNPHEHQAVMEVESDAESGTVVNVLQSGYLIHDRVLRPAMVTVAKKKP